MNDLTVWVVMRLSTFDELVRPALDAAYGGAA